MKILAIRETNPFIQSNASSNRFLSLITGLVSNGNEVDLFFTYSYLNKREKKQFKPKGIFTNINYEYLLPFAFPIRLIRGIFNRLIPQKIYAKKIKKKIANNKYDYIWIGFSPNLIKLGLYLFKYELSVKYFHEQSEYSWIGLDGSKLHNLYLNKFLPQYVS